MSGSPKIMSFKLRNLKFIKFLATGLLLAAAWTLSALGIKLQSGYQRRSQPTYACPTLRDYYTGPGYYHFNNSHNMQCQIWFDDDLDPDLDIRVNPSAGVKKSSRRDCDLHKKHVCQREEEYDDEADVETDTDVDYEEPSCDIDAKNCSTGSHNQYDTPNCFAFALATVLRAKLQADRRDRGVTHEELRYQIVKAYKNDKEKGISKEDSQRKFCRKYGYNLIAIRGNDSEIRKEIKDYLKYENVPVYYSFNLCTGADKEFDRLWKDSKQNSSKRTSVLTKLPRYDKKSKTGRHAIIIYATNTEDRYWKCKNSWGVRWGDEGKCRIGYDAFDAERGYEPKFMYLEKK